jgi:hypothetical protein
MGHIYAPASSVVAVADRIGACRFIPGWTLRRGRRMLPLGRVSGAPAAQRAAVR